MKVRFLLFAFSVFLALFALDLNAKEASLLVKNPKLNDVIDKLKKMPESQLIISKALQDGSITMDLSFKGMPFEAMWESSTRKIVVDGRNHSDQGKLLRYLLFELHNAISESTYQKLYVKAIKGEIDCDSYVQTIEKIEHNNMINTVAIVEKGISAGVFPLSARWEIIYDFPTHYKYQQLTGHSLFIAKEYQKMSPKKGFSNYKGTVKNYNKS